MGYSLFPSSLIVLQRRKGGGGRKGEEEHGKDQRQLCICNGIICFSFSFAPRTNKPSIKHVYKTDSFFL